MSKRRAVLLLRERFRPCFLAHRGDRPTSIHRLQAASPRCSSVETSSSSSRASPRPQFLAMEVVRSIFSCFSSPRSHGLWSSGASDKNKAMVEQLQRYGVIKSTKVAEVMETIDRGLFVPPGGSPYFDSPMAIGYNATISAPHMHAACLELLEDHLQAGMRALDVGSGTGYLTACFALMVGPGGRAVGVEHIPELVASSTENIKKSSAAPQLNDGSLSIHIADGREGWPELAPYDCIHVGAAAPQIPEALIEQLKPGGRMVIPVGTIFQELKVVDKKQDGGVSIRDETSVRYVPLTSKDAQLHSN
ncbi:protein-L-isoaspartate O-methyltransferase-like isoform X1 [Hordeum vulgare subsp. vulgare]|uniref:Protein-L-isoaspartate O-methyltransferase n=1 Tax=Hordeum vulgare subsp. vulgare TaxID=112509 RepID=A0A8I6ZA82_HORVV|nr:protein-L-isoaspartate O-methyltransferase-like isoform X1 [Hordeum vulgare subsp. vulgare]